MTNETETEDPERSKGASEASAEDMRAQIRSLTEASKKRLLISAQYWWRRFRLQSRFTEPDDLLQEAVFRVLSNRRNVPAGVDFETFMSRVMESIASHSVPFVGFGRITARESGGSPVVSLVAASQTRCGRQAAATLR